MTTPASLHLPSLLLPLASWTQRGAEACRDRRALGLLGLAAVLAAVLPGLVGVAALLAIAAVAVSWMAAAAAAGIIGGISIHYLPQLRVRPLSRPSAASRLVQPPHRPPRLVAP